jgi:hypothetical protein
VFSLIAKYGVITNDVSDYIDILVRIAHIICNHTALYQGRDCISLSYYR